MTLSTLVDLIVLSIICAPFALLVLWAIVSVVSPSVAEEDPR